MPDLLLRTVGFALVCLSLFAAPVTAEGGSCDPNAPGCQAPCSSPQERCTPPAPPPCTSGPLSVNCVVHTASESGNRTRQCEPIEFGTPPRIGQCVWDLVQQSTRLLIPQV